MMEMIRLTEAAKYYRGMPHQAEALAWLQASTGAAKQAEFAKRYRRIDDAANFTFINAAKYYEAQPHQIAAWDWLQSVSQIPTLNEFGRLYRMGPKPMHSNYWEQMTHHGSRIPQSEEHAANIKKMVGALEELERWLGVALILTSGYRPEPINSQVGGVPGSQHTLGKAADIYSLEMDDHELEHRVIEYWYVGGRGGCGRGMSYRGFVHIDTGAVRIWDY